MKKFSVLVTGTILFGALVASMAFKTPPSRPSANGQGTLNLPYMNGTPQHFSFHASTDNSGNVSGSFETKSPGQEIRVHGNITCLKVLADGKTAVMSGVVTQVGPNEFGVVVGTTIYFKVKDNGEGANAAGDQFSDYFPANFGCVDVAVGMNTISGGNIQVKP